METFYKSVARAPTQERQLPPRQPIAPAPVSAPIPVSISREDVVGDKKQEESKQENVDRATQELNKKASMGELRPGMSRQRSSIILESAFSPRAAQRTRDGDPYMLPLDADPSMVCSVAYQGMEVLFATARNPNPVVYCICCRTRVILQTLRLASNVANVVSLVSNPANGMVIIALSNGTVQTYHPIPTVSKFSSDDVTQVVTAFGKFRWVNGPMIACVETFYGQENVEEDVFCHEGLMNGSGKPVSVSSSGDNKVLVAHRDQLAVFDVSPIDLDNDDEATRTYTTNGDLPKAELLWTARVERPIESAKLSGDGRAIALVVEGEGLENDNPFGVRTFLRDSEDGSMFRSEILEPKAEQRSTSKPGSLDRSISSSRSIGIVYKPGPFLIHPTSVSTVSFRGFGHNNSNVYPDETEGNDLLMTHCKNGSSVHIFSQNSWKMLTEWAAPPNSRADWVRGISAFNLADLEASKRKKKKTGSAPPSRRPSFASLADASASINADLLGSRPPTYQGPNTAAGAWIAEVTFRNNFPALRLSRLSYMKRGGDEMQPAHFESVAAILPASSLSAESVLSLGDSGLCINGIWPAWNPWRSDSSPSDEAEGSLSGSAMAFLGLSSTSPSPAGFFGENYQAGTHSPPSELRVVASHPITGKVVLMEFPLWGDDEFGAMELGSPLRYELSLCDVCGAERSLNDRSQKPKSYESLVYESSIICSQIEANGKSISLTWRKEGSMSVLPASKQSKRHDSLISVSSSESLDSSRSPSTYEPHPDSVDMEVFTDVSVVPAPLSLPPLSLPHNEDFATSELMIAAKWLTDIAYGGLPQLLVITTDGSLLVYELSPPWSALEPSMPSDDLFVASAANSVMGGGEASTGSFGDDSDDEAMMDGDYEVMLTPDPDFGIGLRLEAQIDGMPAIAGSYKKHPLNRGALPAESTGMIVLGDELVSINGISLEGMSFDDIIATVRQVGTDAPAGSPICMKFRPAIENRRRISTANSAFSISESQRSEGSRRTMEQMLGLNLSQKKQKAAAKGGERLPRPTSMSSVSRATSDVDAPESEPETAQSYCRVIAFVRDALPSADSSNEMDFQSCISILPWHDDPSSQDSCTVLLAIAEGKTLCIKRLDFSINNDSHDGTCTDLGVIDFADTSGGVKKTNDGESRIRAIERVPVDTESWCVAVRHDDGNVRLVFIEICGSAGNESSSIECRISFRHFLIFQVNDSFLADDCLVRASSIELFAALSLGNGDTSTVSVWSSRPSPASVKEGTSHGEIDDNDDSQQYSQSLLILEDEQVVDIRFVPGCLDAFPSVVTMTRTSATVHRRDGGSLKWRPVVRLNFTSLLQSEHQHAVSRLACVGGEGFATTLSPADAIPHLIPTLRSLVSVCDERHYLRSDWHPDAILAYACSAAQGTKTSLQHNVKGIYLWLSRWLDENEEDKPALDAKFPLIVAPLRDFDGHDLLMSPDDTSYDPPSDSTGNLTWSMMTPSLSAEAFEAKSNEEISLEKLQKCMYPYRQGASTDGGKPSEDSSEKQDSLPAPLAKLSTDEIRLLWAIGEMISDSPPFKNLDPEGQLMLFSWSLMRRLRLETDKDQKEPSNDLGLRRMAPPSFLVRLPVRTFRADHEFVPVASAGCLSAICSSSQGCLLETCRSPTPNDKFDWKTARSLRLPLWVRSDTQLRAVCEEIGQTTFKETRNVLDCALYFIATGNRRRLSTFAATDQSMSGRTFLKFITEQDFSSPRGRKAAEKNAYSLLRKKQYIRAASFFLLAEPPMLKSALEVIVTQMEDLDLAFLVARVMGSNSSNAGTQSAGIGAGLGGIGTGFGGIMGMGGGYVSGAADPSFNATDETSFEDWKPSLSKAAKNLLQDRGLSMWSHDPCLKALQLIWLGRKEEASRCLSGLCHESSENDRVLTSDALFPRAFDLRLDDSPTIIQPGRSTNFASPSSSTPGSASDRVLKKANSVINFVSCPFLVKSMNASVRSRWASALLVSRALTRRGVDLVSTRILLQNTTELDLEESDETKSSKTDAIDQKGSQTGKTRVGSASSSIFDSFDPAPKKPLQSDTPSSIFDSFDAVPPKPMKSPVVNDPVSSSIFDGFDAAPPKQLVAQPTPEKQESSSIFDSFEVPPPQKKTAPVNDPMQSSIFDSFDAVPTKKTTKPPTEPATTSIFDSFEPPPIAKASAAPATAITNTTLSIFDSFETPGNGRTVSSVPVANGSTMQQPSVQVAKESSPEDDADDHIPDVASLKTPKIWLEWRRHMLVQAAARRLLREVASVLSCFNGDALDTPMKLFRRHEYPLVPSGAGEILNEHCEGQSLVHGLKLCLDDICAPSKLNKSVVVNQALRVLSCPSRQNRVVYAAILHTLLDRTDQTEEAVRDAAVGLIHRCETIADSNDDLVEKRKTTQHLSSQYLRRLSARVSWQLEICLWLNRGGVFSLSAHTIKEATIAVRTGLLVASWGRCHSCLESMIHNDPDSPMDEEAGAQLWSSMKLIVEPDDRRKNSAAGVGSGGWEFLVDCRRSEATEMLRDKPPGTFIIRPHPQDTGVFTLSFKTNLVPTEDSHGEEDKGDNNKNEEEESEPNDSEKAPPKSANTKPVKKDDVVQHAIIRLSDAGFRCGSFGPFATLLQLLEGVSGSLPFDLLFNKPPAQGIIKDEGIQPSPNSAFLRKLALVLHAKAALNPDSADVTQRNWQTQAGAPEMESSPSDVVGREGESAKAEFSRRKAYGMFLQLSVLSDIRKQLCAIAAAECAEWGSHTACIDDTGDEASVDEISVGAKVLGVEESYAIASRIVRPLLTWCRVLETGIVYEIAPPINKVAQITAAIPVELAASDTAIELAPQDVGCAIHGGDAVVRRMIQPESGVEFRTLRVGEGSDSAMIVLFSKNAATNWLTASGNEKNAGEALARLERMERRRVIEPIATVDLAIKAFTSNADPNEEQDQVRYRFVDPWEVEGLESRDAETMAASLGREHYYEFSVGAVSESCEAVFRKMGGHHLLSLWAYAKGDLRLTKAIASVYAPWERDAGGDLMMTDGNVSEPSAFLNGIREHLYRNALFRLLKLPQRFLSLVQVELLDLKNLTSPGGSASLTVFALVRLKRRGSSARLTNKAKTIDTATTLPTRIGKTSGPNAAASWGSVVRFRFPLPEDVNCDGVSSDADREALFKVRIYSVFVDIIVSLKCF
jgi:hypothetical protein